jgi:hypothetical protein
MRDYLTSIYTIYKTTNCINGKIYIGQTIKNLEVSKYMGSGSYIGKSFLKYGKENFKREIIQTSIIGIIESDKAEKYWIKYFNANDRLIGYNLTEGGHGYQGHNDNVSLETRIKIGEKSKGRILSKESRLKISISKIGIKKSEETKLKMSKSQIGRIVSEETRYKISTSNKGRIINDVSKMSAAQKGYKEYRIIPNNTGKLKSEIAKKNISNSQLGNTKRRKTLYVYDSNLQLIEKYNHAGEFASKNNVSTSYITRAASKNSTANKFDFIFSYLDGVEIIDDKKYKSE